MIRLRLWANAHPMGWFGHAAGDYFFEYDPQWLEGPGAYVLAPQFALRAERYVGLIVRTFFDNLLPEGEALDDIMSALHLRGASSFELLGRLGAELPGVLSLLPEGLPPQTQQAGTPLPYPELSARLANRSRTPLLVSNAHATMSLPGAQDKIGLRFDSKTKRLSDSVGQSPTTHILKPDVWLLRVPEPVFVVARYDRIASNGRVLGLHQIDGCQLLGHGPGWRCSWVMRKRSTQWASTRGRPCVRIAALAFRPPWLNFAAWRSL